MSGLATAAALAVTLAALAWLTATDPKRRRAFRRPPFEGRRHPRLVVSAVLLPGILLLAAGNGVGFVIWLAACTVAGWAMAAVPPTQTRRALEWLMPPARRLSAVAAAALRPWLPQPDRAGGDATATRIARLERRVALLEAALAAARADGGSRDQGVMRIADFQAAKAQHAGEG